MKTSGYKYDPIEINESLADSRSLIMPHQSAAVEAMTKYFELDKDIRDRSGVVVMPTGSGKTYTAVNWLLKEGVAKGYRIVWLVHRQELVEQTFNEFRKQAPILKGTDVKKLRVLPISGGHLHMSMASRADVYVGCIPSVANKYGYRHIERMLGVAGKRKVIVVIDEAHHAVAQNYRKVITRIKNLNPNMVLLGLTATPFRMGEYGQKLLRSMFNVNTNLKNNKGKNGYVYEISMKELVATGFLAKAKYEKVGTQLEGKVEYKLTEAEEEELLKYADLTEKIRKKIGRSSARNKIIVDRYLANQERYGKTIIFAVDQDHAERLYEELKKANVSCDYAISSRGDSQDVIQRFKDNKFKVLINVMMLTEGSDVPDIQTVFLTRETNSKSLLMQMIGRGLRGVKSGGTKIAYIVGFHDIWNDYIDMLDPGKLEIFEDVDTLLNQEDEEKGEIEPREIDDTEEDGGDIEIIEESDLVRKIYLKLYNSMRVSLIKENDVFALPVGWYAVLNEDGEDENILVYEEQIECYKDIELNLKRIKNRLDAIALIDIYFADTEVKPNEVEMNYLLDYIEETGEMPTYYTFEQRDKLDPHKIAQKMIKLYEKDEDREAWLKNLFDKNSILQNIYKYFYAFKKTVYDTLKEETEANIVHHDEREEYKIIENYYDLNQCLAEVLERYPKLDVTYMIKISWSRNIIRSWFARTEKPNMKSKYFQLTVNKMMSSPRIKKEIIKYLIFHELLHANGYWDHDDDFRNREWQYPNSAELDGILDSLQYEYKMENIYDMSVYDEKAIFDSFIEINNAEELISDDNLEKNIDNQTLNVIKENEKNVYDKNAKGVEVGYKYCRNCGNKLPEDAKFCDKCGSAMNY